MDDLKATWGKQDRTVQIGVAVAVALLSAFVVWKALPAIIAAMGIGLFLMLLFVPYWLPTIIAFKRDHPSKGAVLAVNFFFGWTFVGWFLALVWAAADNSRGGGSQTIVVNNTIGMPLAPPAAALPTQYQVGDVVNGHRFNGIAWIPVQAGQPVQDTVAPPTPDDRRW